MRERRADWNVQLVCAIDHFLCVDEWIIHLNLKVATRFFINYEEFLFLFDAGLQLASLSVLYN